MFCKYLKFSTAAMDVVIDITVVVVVIVVVVIIIIIKIIILLPIFNGITVV